MLHIRIPGRLLRIGVGTRDMNGVHFVHYVVLFVSVVKLF